MNEYTITCIFVCLHRQVILFEWNCTNYSPVKHTKSAQWTAVSWGPFVTSRLGVQGGCYRTFVPWCSELCRNVHIHFSSARRQVKTESVSQCLCVVAAASGSGSDGGRGSLGDEIRKALANNNTASAAASGALAKRALSGGDAATDELGESSDTQSAGGGSSSSARHGRHLAHVTYPKDSDKQKLLDLIRPQSNDDVNKRAQLRVKKVTSKKYSDTDSSSSGSEPSSPHFSARPDSFGGGDSVRSSMRSSSAVSSEGRMTIVTESYISDIDTISVTTEPPQETPIMVPHANKPALTSPGASNAKTTTAKTTSKSLKPAAKKANSPDIATAPLPTSPSVLSEYEPAETLVLHKMINHRRGDAGSSDSDSDFTTEQITKVKFRRVSKKGQRSRSPSPESRREEASKTSTSKG